MLTRDIFNMKKSNNHFYYILKLIYVRIITFAIFITLFSFSYFLSVSYDITVLFIYLTVISSILVTGFFYIIISKSFKLM